MNRQFPELLLARMQILTMESLLPQSNSSL
jgi:hypothetical protein